MTSSLYKGSDSQVLIQRVADIGMFSWGKKMTMVKEVMSGVAIAVSPATPCIEVARQMKASETGAIAVCDNGRFYGIIAEHDIVHILATASVPLEKLAGSMFSNRSPVISPDDDIMQAANVMVDNGVRVLPVVQSGKLLGLFTLENLARKSLAVAALVFARTIKLQMSEGDKGKETAPFLTVAIPKFR